MKTVTKSVLLWYSADEMFALVTDVPAYPEFLPWCDHANVLSEDAGGMVAEIGISLGVVRQSFTTRNQHVPGREVRIELVDGPFSQLEGEWRFIPLGNGAERACRVELELRYAFRNAALRALVGPVFDGIAANMVDAFVKRAGEVYGEPA